MLQHMNKYFTYSFISTDTHTHFCKLGIAEFVSSSKSTERVTNFEA